MTARRPQFVVVNGRLSTCRPVVPRCRKEANSSWIRAAFRRRKANAVTIFCPDRHTMRRPVAEERHSMGMVKSAPLPGV